ncbi:MAG: EAL domain-containing protein [Deltaproteobacteria bacterium]|nr:EAL domain-containing protein [Deltaproteobacteria bacterium]
MAALLGSTLVAAAGLFFGGAIHLARLTAPGGREAELPDRRTLGLLAGVGALVGLAGAAAGSAVGLALGDAQLEPPWSWLVDPDLAALACVVAALLFVRDQPGDRPGWLIAPALALIVPWIVLSFGSDAAGVPPLSFGLLAAVACALLLSPGRRVRRVAEARWEAFHAAGDGIIVLDGSGRILESSGDPAEALLASSPTAPTEDGRRLPGIIEVRLSDPESHYLRVRAGKDRFLEVWRGGAAEPGSPDEIHALLVRDISKQYRDEKKLIRLAHYDSVTGLANRRLFLDQLKRDLAEAVGTGEHAALLHIDLDHFKEINDSLGHAAGDTLLEGLASRLSDGLQPSQIGVSMIPENARITVARLSGDEFAVIVSRLADAEAARELAHRVLQLIAEPVQVQQRALVMSASIGIALYPKDGEDVETLIHSADAAVGAAKSRGRSGVAFYEPAIDSGRKQISRIALELGHAIERSELSFHYQPRVDMETGTVVGLEALMRWSSAELGEVAPNDFIPVAEERGLICALGAWSVDEACRQIRSWREEGFEPVPVSVNVSSVQFRETDLQRVVSEALETHEVDPRLLEIEITEGLLLDAGEDTAPCLRDLRAMGLRIALDDFGTGYSALTYLNLFPLDILKLDRGFLCEIHLDDSAAQMASAVVSMAHSLGLSVVAEGVDSDEQLEVLRGMGCDQIQGFLYSPGLPPNETPRFLARAGEERPLLQTVNEQTVNPPGQQADENALDGAEQGLVAMPVDLGAVDSAEEAPTPALLLVDDGEGSLRSLTERLVRLEPSGIDLHYASAADEARLMVEQERLEIRLMVAPPAVNFAHVNAIRMEVTERLGHEPQLVILGEEPDAALRSRMRECGVSFVLWSPFDDTELTFVLKSALTEKHDVARRLEVRVPVDLTARLRAGSRREVVVLSRLSRRGAFIELSDPLDIDARVQLEFDLGSEQFRFFARVVHQEREDGDSPFSITGNGLAFYGSDHEAELRLCKLVEERGTRYLP